MAAAKYQHFTIEQMAEGVYAALATDAGSAACNAGIVVCNGRTFVFDTCATITAGRELREAAAALTGNAATYVMNSHVHPDHVHGNVVFADAATLIAAAGTRAAMAEVGLARMEGFRNQISGSVTATEKQLAATTDPQELTRLRGELETGRAFLSGYPTPEDYRLPHLTFTGELTFHGNDRSVKLIDCGEAHSECDSVLYLPEEGILFSGDLLTEGELVLRYGNPEKWLRVLDRLEALQPQVVVPGHGVIRPAEAALSGARQYLLQLMQAVEQAVAQGATEESVSDWPVPDGQSAYWFHDNVRFLVRRALAARHP